MKYLIHILEKEKQNYRLDTSGLSEFIMKIISAFFFILLISQNPIQFTLPLLNRTK
jgi:hypothetical protein